MRSSEELNITIDAVTFHCPDGLSEEFRPNIVVVVNFTMLNIKLNSTINRGKNSVQVMLGLTNDTIEVFDRTPPTTLIPGVNVVGIAGLLIRQTFRRPKYSAFGLFDVSTSLLQTYQGSDFIIVVP